MSLKRIRSHALAGICGGAALVLAAACGPNTAERSQAANPNAETPTASNQANPSTNQAITVTGCLQRAGNDFVLTAMNEPATSGAPAPTGTSATGNRVDREQMTEAKHAYKLTDVDDDQLKPMVGNSVQVVGTIARPSEVAQAMQKSNDLDKGDLAEVHVARVQRVADSCGK
jgi:hypothetical protein